MIVKPSIGDLLKKAPNGKYSLVIGTAKRARQISAGSKPMTNEDDTSAVTLAADEIEEGKVTLLDEEEWKNHNTENE